MTYGSSHSRCESNVHTYEKPASSACLARSTTRHAGGLHCSTTPKSTAALSGQVRGQAAADEPAVPCPPGELAVGENDRPAREHGVDPAGDVEALVRRVVHVHVVRVHADDRARRRV